MRPEPLTAIANSTTVSLEYTEDLLRQNKVATVEYTEALVTEINDPENNRPFSPKTGLCFPFKEKPLWFDRNEIYNPKTGVWELRQTAAVRGATKSTPFTKKKSLHLVKNKKFYGNYYELSPIYLMVELEKCHLKNQKYIFEKILDIREKWWIKPTAAYEQAAIESHSHVDPEDMYLPLVEEISLYRSIPLTALQNSSSEFSANTIFAGVSKKAVVGLFLRGKSLGFDYVSLQLKGRLSLLLIKKQLHDTLQINLPLFVSKSVTGKLFDKGTGDFFPYLPCLQILDLQCLLFGGLDSSYDNDSSFKEKVIATLGMDYIEQQLKQVDQALKTLFALDPEMSIANGYLDLLLQKPLSCSFNIQLMKAGARFNVGFKIRKKICSRFPHEKKDRLYLDEWYYILDAVLLGNADLNCNITSQYPLLMGHILAKLEALQDKLAYYKKKYTFFFYTEKQVQRARLQLLVHLTEPLHGLYCSISSGDKRLLEKHYCEAIAAIMSLSELEQFYTQWKTSLANLQHRHPLFDKMRFRLWNRITVQSTTYENRILTAINNRAMQLYPQLEDQTQLDGQEAAPLERIRFFQTLRSMQAPKKTITAKEIELIPLLRVHLKKQAPPCNRAYNHQLL